MTFCNEDRTQSPTIESRYREKHMSQETVSEGGSLGELDGENAPELLWDAEGDEKKIDKVLKKFDEHCEPRKTLVTK